MAKSGEFYTFDEVVRQLKIDENKLKRLVSEGEISAFREGDVMKFKKSEIDKLARKGAGSETSETVLSEITLEDEGPKFEESGETLTDDLVFEGAGDEVKISGEGGMKTQEISSQDTFIESGKGGGDVGMTTEPIDLSADLTQDVEEEAEEVAAKKESKKPAGAARGARRPAAPAEAGSPGISFALVLCSILLLLATYLMLNLSDNEVGSDPLGDGFARGLSGVFYEKMGSTKDTVKKKIDETTRGLPAAGGAAPTR
jgi:excisionase family DNA binding protein